MGSHALIHGIVKSLLMIGVLCTSEGSWLRPSQFQAMVSHIMDANNDAEATKRL